MKIWIVNHFAVSPDQPGGTRHYMLARELARRGHEPTIVASSVSYSTRRESHLDGSERERIDAREGVTFLWLRTPPYGGRWIARLWNMLVFALRLLFARSMRRHGRPDVVIGSTPQLFSALAASLLARARRVPFVLEVRDLWPESLVALGRISRFHPFILLLRAIELHLYRRAVAIVTLLPSSHDYFAACGVPRERVHWVPNGVDVASLPPLSAPPGGDPFTVMYAGAHGLANDLDIVLDAAALLRARPVRFRLIGEGPEKERLRRRAAEEGLANVIFEPARPKESVHATLVEADAFLMNLASSPLFRWGISPNKLYDYMAAARPVVFAVSTPYNPVADANAGVTAAAGDPRALAAAIERLMETPPEERRAMGAAGRAYVESHFDVSVLAGRLESVLRSVTR